MEQTDNEGNAHADFTFGRQKNGVVILLMKR